MPQASVLHSHIDARNVRPIVGFDASEFAALAKIGINISPRDVRQMMAAYADGETGMDALQAPITTPTVTNPVQFLQNWLPGFVEIITNVRKIDEILGITTAGSWEDEEIVQGVMEPITGAVPYGDYTNVPLSSWNVNFNTRTVVRFEQGMSVALLEEARSARIKINSADQKRQSATLGLEINRNYIGLYGYNNGLNYTFGFLNDANLGAYVEVAQTGTGASPMWANKNYLQIVQDLLTAFQQLRTNSGANIDPKKTPTSLVLASASVDYLSTVSQYGNSVMEWLTKSYPMCRVVDAPELNGAHLSDNVFYLQADSVEDGGTDDKKTWLQIVPAKFKVLGIEQRAKGYVEDYSNATAGAMLKRPYAVVRYYGI